MNEFLQWSNTEIKTKHNKHFGNKIEGKGIDTIPTINKNKKETAMRNENIYWMQKYARDYIMNRKTLQKMHVKNVETGLIFFFFPAFLCIEVARVFLFLFSYFILVIFVQ